MKKITMISIFGTISITTGGCYPDRDHHIENTSIDQHIDELNCAFLPVSAPASGATFDPVSLNNCVSTGAMSPDSSYNYTACKKAYLVDFLSIADNTSPSSFADRAKFTLFVRPATPPSTQSSCVNTTIKFYVYGTDSDGVLWHFSSRDGNAVAISAKGTWVPASGLFASRCEFNGVENGISQTVDLNRFTSDFSGRIQSIRIAAQATTIPFGLIFPEPVPVSVSINAGAFTSPSFCIH